MNSIVVNIINVVFLRQMISGGPQGHFTAHCIVYSVNVNVTNNNKKKCPCTIFS